MLNKIIIAFIPLFVAIDPIGLIPILAGFTDGFEPEEIKTVYKHAMMTAFAVMLSFVVLGKIIFDILGISIEHFSIAGGLILFLLASRDLIGTEKAQPPLDTAGIVPIGMPLIAGPAVIATLLLLVDHLGMPVTLVALGLNMAILWLVFQYGHKVTALIGNTTLLACSKIVSMLLCSIAVSMVLTAILNILKIKQ